MINIKKERQSNIELLRMLSMFMIVILHIFDCHIHKDYGTNIFLIQISVSTLCIVGVNVFVFISGYFGIRTSIKSILKIILQALFYSWICLFIYLLVSPSWKIADIIRYTFPVSTGLWWFLTTYVVLMLMAPFINKGIEYFSKKQNALIISGLLFFDIVGLFTYNPSTSFNGSTIFHFVTLYCLARYMNKYEINIRKGLLIYIISIVLLLSTIILLYFKYQRITGLLVLWGYSNPLIIAGAVGLFYAFKNIPVKSKWINNIAGLVFAVYLIHNHQFIWDYYFKPYIGNLMDNYQSTPITLTIIFFISGICIFTISIIIEKIRQLIFSPVIERINYLVIKNTNHGKTV